MTNLEEHEVIRDMASENRHKRHLALELVYKSCFYGIERLILANNGSQADAKDIFQEGVMILYQNIVNNKFRSDSSVSTYLHSICRNLWIIQLKKNERILLSEKDQFLRGFEETENAKVKIDTIKNLVQNLKVDCQKILTGFYYEMKSMKNLAALFGLGSEQAAKNKKSRCLKYLAKMVDKENLKYDDFLE